MIFQQIKVGASVITLFRLILIGKSISYYYFHDSRSSSMSKGQCKSQIIKKYDFYQIKLRNCVIPHFHENQ